jgi:hypothetical protein
MFHMGLNTCASLQEAGIRSTAGQTRAFPHEGLPRRTALAQRTQPVSKSRNSAGAYNLIGLGCHSLALMCEGWVVVGEHMLT